MKLKHTALSLGAALCLSLSMTVGASALEYNIDAVEETEYYRSTNYESAYRSEYNYGGPNASDYDIPELPYGISSNASIGPMEKVPLPGLNVSPNGGTESVGAIGNSDSGLYAPVIPENPSLPVYQQPAYTSTADMVRKDGSIGTLKIPTLDINMKVWEGETNASMAKGLGHYSSTSGWDGNIGVCGHNRGAKYTIGDIKDLEIGDTITYTTVYGTRTYKVVFVGTISSTDWSYLQATADNRITLTTCLANRPNFRVCVQAVAVK